MAEIIYSAKHSYSETEDCYLATLAWVYMDREESTKEIA